MLILTSRFLSLLKTPTRKWSPNQSAKVMMSRETCHIMTIQSPPLVPPVPPPAATTTSKVYLLQTVRVSGDRSVLRWSLMSASFCTYFCVCVGNLELNTSGQKPRVPSSSGRAFLPKLINTAEAAILESPMIYRLQSYQDYQDQHFWGSKNAKIFLLKFFYHGHKGRF